MSEPTQACVTKITFPGGQSEYCCPKLHLTACKHTDGKEYIVFFCTGSKRSFVLDKPDLTDSEQASKGYEQYAIERNNHLADLFKVCPFIVFKKENE